MTDFAVSIESLISEADSLTYQAAAMESVTALGLRRSEARSIDSALIRMGMESTTTMAMQISTEGVFAWIKDKLSKIGRKVNIVINKIYAKITGADEKTKALIARAAKDDSVKLPISGGKATAIIAAATAVIGAITYFSARAFGGEGDDNKVKQWEAKMAQSFKNVFKMNDEDKKQREAEKNLKKERNEKAAGLRKARRERDKAMFKEGKDKFGNAVEKQGMFGMAGTKAVNFLKAIQRFFKQMFQVVKNFGVRLKSEISGAEGEAKKNDENAEAKSGLWARIKNLGGSISKIFRAITGWFRNCWGGIFWKGSGKIKSGGVKAVSGPQNDGQYGPAGHFDIDRF